MFVAIIKREFILDASARLNYSLNAFITCNFHAVGEGEESIARHYGAVQVEAEVLGLLNGLFQGVHTAGLTYTACQQLLAFSQYNSVGLAVLHYLVREKHIFDFLCSRSLGRHGFQVFGSLDLQVTVLNQNAIQQRAELFLRQSSLLANQNYTVLLLTENFQCIHVIIGSYDNFKEYLVDFFGSRLVNHGICDEHTAECRYGITCKRIVPCFQYSRT